MINIKWGYKLDLYTRLVLNKLKWKISQRSVKFLSNSRTLNTEASYDIRLRDRRAVWGILVVELHHKLRRIDLAVFLRNLWQVEFPQKALLHGSQEVLHPGVGVFRLHKVLLWQLIVELLRVLTLNVIVERFTITRASRNHKTQTHLEQEWSWALHAENKSFWSDQIGTDFTLFSACDGKVWKWRSARRTTVLMSAPMLQSKQRDMCQPK